MLFNAPSLRQIMALQCPVCGHILTQSEREIEYYFCEQCTYSIPAFIPEQPKNLDDNTKILEQIRSLLHMSKHVIKFRRLQEPSRMLIDLKSIEVSFSTLDLGTFNIP